jgi:hypothetical protein
VDTLYVQIKTYQSPDFRDGIKSVSLLTEQGILRSHWSENLAFAEDPSMKRLVDGLFLSLLVTGICIAQSAQSQGSATASQDTSASASKAGARTNTSAAASEATTVSDKNKQVQAVGGNQLQAGSTMQAELTKPLDARKNKVGDSVIAKTIHDVTSGGRVVVPKGSKLVGHVTEVRTQTKDQAGSALGIAFDHAMLKNGTKFPVSLTVQAIGHAQASTPAGDDEMMAAGAGAMGSSTAHTSGGGLLNGAATTTGRAVNTAGNTAGAVTNTTGSVSGQLASGSLTSTSQGVVGIRGVSLSADASNSTHSSVITSNGGNVHLDSGTEMVLRVDQ